MARKPDDPKEPDANDAAQAVRDSAQKIWLAGLGAFERAKTEGPRVFESLVEQGRNMGARAVGMADEALKGMREGNYNASGSLEKLEKMFEQGVSRSLKGLGVMTARDVEELSRQVRELNESVRNLMSGAGSAAAGSARAGARKASRSGTSRKASAARGGSAKRKPAARGAASKARKKGA